MYHPGELDNVKGYKCVGIEVYGKFLFLPLSFSVNQKSALKTKSKWIKVIKEPWLENGRGVSLSCS